MKREIKFRGWDKKEEKMNYYTHWSTLHNKQVLVFEEEHEYVDDSYYQDDIELMQYTGIKDKNGKEIYEGDIVRCYDTAGEKVYDREVYFFEFRKEIWSKEENGLTKVEIIGNIYQNPELLK